MKRKLKKPSDSAASLSPFEKKKEEPFFSGAKQPDAAGEELVADATTISAAPDAGTGEKNKEDDLPVQAAATPAPGMKWKKEVAKGTGTGGWKTTDSFVKFYALYPNPRDVRCDFTIGVPQKNMDGDVSDAYATEVSIAAINEVGGAIQEWLRSIDPLELTPESVIVSKFISGLEARIKLSIPGSRVTRNIKAP